MAGNLIRIYVSCSTETASMKESKALRENEEFLRDLPNQGLI